MCSIGDNWLKDVNYLDVRKKDLKELTNSYINFQDRLLELENKPMNSGIKREINDTNDALLKLQNKIFKNNKKNLEYIMTQKEQINKKNKAIDINKKFLEDVKKKINNNEDLSQLRDARMTESTEKNNDVGKFYTGYFICIVLFIIVQIVLVILIFKGGDSSSSASSNSSSNSVSANNSSGVSSSGDSLTGDSSSGMTNDIGPLPDIPK